jgi:hypothetical protein
MSNFSKDFKRKIATLPVLLVLFGIGLYLMAKVEPAQVTASNTYNVSIDKKTNTKEQNNFSNLTSYTSPWPWTYNQFNPLMCFNGQYYCIPVIENENSHTERGNAK